MINLTFDREGHIVMTGREIEGVRRTLPSRIEIPWKQWTPEQQRLDKEISCREMINSCLAYGGIDGFWEECEWRTGDKSYAAPHIRALGIDRVRELVSEQTRDFEHATILRDVYTDSEGVTYNSIIWGDEVVK